MRLTPLTRLAALALLAPMPAAAQSFENCAVQNSAVQKTGLTGCNNPFLIGAGLDANLFASLITVTYFGSSAGNWHSMWAFKASDIVNGVPTTNPITSGQLLFCKFANCATNSGEAGGQASVAFGWTTNTELVFGFFTGTGADATPGSWGSGTWYFSGDPSRNPDGQAHLALFNNNGIYRDDRTSLMAGTNGAQGAVGFEDRTAAQSSDWDFNDAGFLWSVTYAPVSTVPEPATMVLLASGLVGLGVAGRIRRRR